jgi:outer membrane protein assembly factor BamB
MAVLRLVRLFMAAGLLLVLVGAAAAQSPARRVAAAPPTTVSSRYAVTDVNPVLRVGSTVYVGGVSRVAPVTGSAVVVSAANGRAEPVRARVAGGSVRAAIADNAGGWYIGGTFSSVGGVSRPGLAHLSSDGTLDTAFAPPELGSVNALALDAGRLYVGGATPFGANFSLVPVLSALDPVTGAVLPISYPPLTNMDGPAVVALAAGGGRVYAAFSGYDGVAAYDENSGALQWSQPGTPSESLTGPTALALAEGKLLVGGQISTPTGPVALEELDPVGGTVVGQIVDRPVSAIATVAGTAYILIDRGAGAGVWKLDLSHDTWTRLAGCKYASAITTDGTTLYVSKWAPVASGSRIYALKLHRAKPSLRALSTVTAGGSADALALQSGRLLVGGGFLGLGGAKRPGLAAFDARTGKLLPWRPVVQGGVNALAHSGKKIYLGGGFTRVAGKRRDGLAAVSALGKGNLLPWHPRLSDADIGSLAVAHGRVFAGGTFTTHRGKASTLTSSLVAFSARSGKRLAFTPRFHGVTVLTVWHRLLLAGSFSNHGAWGAGVAAFRTGGHGRVLWKRSVEGGNVPIVFALQTDGSTLYVGGRFSRLGGQPRTNLAALALDRSGALLDFAPQIPDQVMALARTDYGLVFSTMKLQGPTWLGAQALGAVSPDGQVLPWQITYPPSEGSSGVDHLAVVPGGLVAGGGFSWIGPADNPAPGALVWLR